MITPEESLDSPSLARFDYLTLLRGLRHDIIERYRPHLQEGPGPIRMMARIVAELEKECRERGIPEDIIKSQIVNRTIGDINLRLIAEFERGEMGEDYRQLADELGVALPGENIAGYTATGDTYLWLRAQMMENERLLLAKHIDLRMYDIYGVGNPLLRARLAQEMTGWGLPVSQDQIAACLGAMDGIDKVLRSLRLMFKAQGMESVGILFPEPGFGVPEWQARSFDYTLYRFPTLEEHNFKLTGEQLDRLLSEHPDIRVIYLAITNNPTAFAYTPEELQNLHHTLRKHREAGHTVYIVADLAYIGTGKPEEDYARMTAFAETDVLKHTIFVSSFSKIYSLTGERFGWVTVGNVELMPVLSPCWTNTMASLPGEWQLRFMAYLRLFDTHPQLAEKLRAFYRMRRQRFIAQLHRIDEEQHFFKHIYLDDDATVYNWSQLHQGEDAFSLFEKTGIAGVPGSGFGYTDGFIRFSIGVIPPTA